MAVFVPQELSQEIRLVVDELVQQYENDGILLHYQRTQLFRAIVTYIFEYGNSANPEFKTGIPETYIHNISVHVVAQAIVDLQTAGAEEQTMEVEPWKGQYCTIKL